MGFPLLVLLLCALPLSQAQSQALSQALSGESHLLSNLRENQTKVEQLQQERSEVEKRIGHFEASEKELLLEIGKLSNLVRESKRRKDGLEENIARKTALIGQQENDLVSLRTNIRAGKSRIGNRLLRLYRLSKGGRAAVLFQMARYQTFVKDSHYLALLQEADRRALLEFQSLNEKLRKKKKEVELNLERLIGLREELDQETRRLFERESFLKTSLRDVGKNRQLFRSYLKDLEKTMEGMERAIVRLEKQASEEKSAREAVRPEKLRGTLPAPVKGRVIAGFGEQDPRYDLKKFQRGIVFRVLKNAPVTAVAGGRAVHAGTFRGYQSLVVLDHGQGLFTVYGHLEQLQIQQGDRVKPGDPLGRATYQPVDEAYDVYFEIRHNGKPDDPLLWLRPGLLQPANLPATDNTDSSEAGG